MIDPKKWEEATEEMKMMTVKVINNVATENSITKSDTKLITEFPHISISNPSYAGSTPFGSILSHSSCVKSWHM